VFDFFFYGTLVDADVRTLVLGRDVPDEEVVPAVLSGFRRYTVRRQPYPAAVPVSGASVDGVVLSGVSVRDAAMLSCFEGGDYDAQRHRVTSSTEAGRGWDAWVYVASDRVLRGEPVWSIDDWRAHHKPDFMQIANTWLDGIRDADIAAAERVWHERLTGRDGR